MRPGLGEARAWGRASLGSALMALAVACGDDYRPPALDTTGAPAAPLDQVFDLDVSLPGIVIAGATRGIGLEVRVSIEGSGYGELPARFVFGPATVDGVDVDVVDLTPRPTSVLVTPDTWSSGQLGPLVVEGVAFELLLDGSPADDGWSVGGRALESQTGTEGLFQGWRRHRFLVVGTDFLSEVGSVAEVALVRGNELEVRTALEFTSSDPLLRLTGGAVFAINRFTFDNLQRLDPALEFRTAWQAALGAGSNPQDVLLVSETKGYVSRYEPPYDDVAVFDPRRGTILASIPLESLTDEPPSPPRASRLALAEGTVFVALQDIDRTFSDFGEGKLAVIDPELDEVVGVVPLGGKNPWEIETVRGTDDRTRLYVSLAGIFPGLQAQELSGGVVVVDAFDRVVERWALDDDDAGGNVASLAMVSDELGYVVVTDASFLNRVLAFDPRDGSVLRTVWESYDLIPDLDADTSGMLAIPDRSFFQPRLCLYRTLASRQGEPLLGCALLPLPPFSVEALD